MTSKHMREYLDHAHPHIRVLFPLRKIVLTPLVCLIVQDPIFHKMLLFTLFTSALTFDHLLKRQ